MRQFKRATAIVAAMAIVIAGVTFASDALAKKESKRIRADAEWIEYNEGDQTVKAKIKKTTKKTKLAPKGKEVLFNVKSEGSVLNRTTVKVNGRGGKLTDITAGKSVFIYFEERAGKPFATSVDVTFSEEELNRRFPDAD